MHVEIIGCTSAGKTTLARKIVEAGKRRGVDVVLGDDFVLEKLHLGWVKNEFMRRRTLEIYSGFICMIHWRKYREFSRFVLTVVFQAPGSWFYKVNLARNALRKIGIHEIIRNYSPESKIVLVDNDGIVQTAHNIFVHSNGSLEADLSNFVKLAPMPDMLAYLRQPETILVERTLKRGHPRLPDRSQSKVQNFVEQAVATFENLQKIPQIAERLCVIDNENKTVKRKSLTNEQVAEQAYDLMQEIIDNDPSGKSEPEQKATDTQPAAPCVELITRLIESLNAQSIDYCHWKSNIKLKEGMEGEEDLDIFVNRKSLPRLFPVLAQLGFKAARIKYGPDTPSITHYYGLDAKTGKLVHLHLFTSILTGESFVKSHLFPFENLLLENSHKIGQLAVLSKPAELVLFVLRTYIKYASLLDMIRLFRKPSEVSKELKWLLDGGDISHTLSLLRTHCPVVDETLFLRCIDAIDKNRSFLTRMLLARRVKRQIRCYAKYTYTKRAQAYAAVLFAKFRRILKGNIKSKMLHTGGAMIAIVGADATGKSTLVKETSRWLGKNFIVKVIHTGKPPSSILTFPINILLTVVRKVLSSGGGDRFEKGGTGDSNPTGHKFKGLSSFPYALRSVSLAWDRQRLIRKNRRLAADGKLIVCDRYPSRTIGAMDSPRLEEETRKKGLFVRIYNRLARLEKRLYARIPPPDIVLRLRVSLEIAKKRNRERGTQDNEVYLEARHRQSQAWYMPGTSSIYDIDTEQSLEDTIRNVKKSVWESL